jgi:hypothetical protein
VPLTTASLGGQQQQPAKTSALLGPRAITGAVNNGGGLIRLTVTAHGFTTGNKVTVANVGGVPNATGNWTVTVVSADVIDLQGSTFAGTYTSGGVATRTARA